MLSRKRFAGFLLLSSIFSLIFLSILIPFTACSGFESQPRSETPESSEAQKSSKISGSTEIAFPDIAGWSRAEKIKRFDPNTLWDYIDGAAELYLSYDFEELQVAEYTTEKGASCVIEMYRHRTPYDAFGIYSQERPSEGTYLQIGAQGYFDEAILNFLSGDHYVKISCYDLNEKVQETLTSIARMTAGKLGSAPSLPWIVRCFPEKKKKMNSEQFVAKNFLGYEFLHSGFTADYEDSGNTFTLFIIEGSDPQDCEKMLRLFLQKTNQLKGEMKEGEYTINDPYHGEMALIWKGKYIWGTSDLKDRDKRSHYLTLIEQGLKKTE